MSVLMLDLDDFKLVNDTFGHLFGDRVLTWTAELIRATLRASDVAGAVRRRRVRGHPARDRRGRGRRSAERILDAFRDHAFVGEQRGPVPIAHRSASPPSGDGRTATELIAAADGPLPGQARGRPRCRRPAGRRRLTAAWPGAAPDRSTSPPPRLDGTRGLGPPSSIPT